MAEAYSIRFPKSHTHPVGTTIHGWVLIGNPFYIGGSIYGVFEDASGRVETFQIARLKTAPTHGRKATRTHNGKSYDRAAVRKLVKVRSNMINRCHVDDTTRYWKYYGGRGITVCDEWRNDLWAFVDWALSHGWEQGLTIDRFPNLDGNYEPTNCRWVPLAGNARKPRKLALKTLI